MAKKNQPISEPISELDSTQTQQPVAAAEPTAPVEPATSQVVQEMYYVATNIATQEERMFNLKEWTRANAILLGTARLAALPAEQRAITKATAPLWKLQGLKTIAADAVLLTVEQAREKHKQGGYKFAQSGGCKTC